jgi:hypothetical protein
MGNAEFHIRSVRNSETQRVDDVVARIISNYNTLLSMANNRLKLRILRSFAWYRKGRWEETMHAQYISYWIALEQLVVNTGGKRREKLERLLKIIPKLILSWQDLESTYPIRNLIRLIVSEIKNDPSLRSRLFLSPLKNWESTPITLLENLQALKKMTTNT